MPKGFEDGLLRMIFGHPGGAKKLSVIHIPVFVGPCHHGMARPQVADGGMVSDMEGSCE